MRGDGCGPRQRWLCSGDTRWAHSRQTNPVGGGGLADIRGPDAGCRSAGTRKDQYGFGDGTPAADLQDRHRSCHRSVDDEAKAWKTVWSAGQGVAAIDDVLSIQDLVAQLKSEFKAAYQEYVKKVEGYL